MKKIFYTLILSAFVAITAAAQTTETPQKIENPNAPEIVFENEVLDYGTIEFGSNGEREFKFKNTGKEPLIIQSASGSCGCTVPTPPKEPIKPGETGVIKVSYDTKRQGNFDKTVTVVSNAKTGTKVIRIKGVVKPDPKTLQNTETPTQK
jgi:Protein of unknown function (DUF1573)